MKNKNGNHEQILISFKTLRKIIGILGLTLPAVLILGTCAIGSCSSIQYSISHYYYTMMGDVFVGEICAIALFLMTYKGFDNDHVFTMLAGIFALGVAFFPTTTNEDVNCCIREINPSKLRENMHFGSAALFFVILAYISAFLFTKSDEVVKKGSQKYKRNVVYRTCAILILVAIALIAILNIGDTFEAACKHYKLVFWLEWVALFAFGVSWLVKGETIFKDEGAE